MRQANKLLMAFLAMEFIIPFFLNIAFDTEPIFRTPLHLETVVFWFCAAVLLYSVTVFFADALPIIGSKKVYALKPISHKFLLIFLVLNIAIVFSTFSLNLVQWRYSLVGISDRPLLALFAFSQFFITFILFWILIADHPLLLSRKPFHFLLKLLIAANLLGSINGLGTTLLALFFLTLMVLPNVILPWMFKLDSAKLKTRTTSKALSFIALPLVILLLAQPLLIRGFTAKSGADADIALNIAAHTSFNYIINRHSVHMSQTLAALEDGPDPENLSIVKNSFLYRANILFGKPFQITKPEISSYARKALVQFSDFGPVNPRGGSSPGLLATFFMSFPLVFAFPFLFVFLVILSNFTNYLLFSQPKLTWIGAFILSYFFVRLYLDSPFDTLLPGPPMGILIFTIIMSFRRVVPKHTQTSSLGLIGTH